MPTAPDNNDAHDYAERIRERLPRRPQELPERCVLSNYGLAREDGLSREYIGELERGALMTPNESGHENRALHLLFCLTRVSDQTSNAGEYLQSSRWLLV
jgi:hypothetical protein